MGIRARLRSVTYSPAPLQEDTVSETLAGHRVGECLTLQDLEQETRRMAVYKLTIELDDWAEMHGDALTLENKVMDLIRTAVLPTLDLNSGAFQLTRKRG
jgi:hypothetical protein